MSAFDRKRTSEPAPDLRQPAYFQCIDVTRYDGCPEPGGAAMRRRDFIALIGGTLADWPRSALAEDADKVIHIGYLGPSLKAPSTAAQYQVFLNHLKQSGFTEGQNLAVDYRRVDDPRGPFAVMAEPMRPPPKLIIAHGPEAALQAVVGASQFIPIVIIAINFDPIERGYVKSLAQPGGNITGVYYRQLELTVKEVELLAEAFPDRKRLGILWDAISTDEFQAATRTARSHSLELQPLKLENPPYDFPAAFRDLADKGAQMVLILSSPYFTEHRPEIAALAIEHRLPTMYIFRPYVDAGGLMSYGVDQSAVMESTAALVAKILKGAKPADLPLEQAVKFELVVNLKTAKAIGVTLPTAILLRADQVIE
jgi:putative ABC transport system substrate-binding protein